MDFYNPSSYHEQLNCIYISSVHIVHVGFTFIFSIIVVLAFLPCNVDRHIINVVIISKL